MQICKTAGKHESGTEGMFSFGKWGKSSLITNASITRGKYATDFDCCNIGYLLL